MISGRLEGKVAMPASEWLACVASWEQTGNEQQFMVHQIEHHCHGLHNVIRVTSWAIAFVQIPRQRDRRGILDRLPEGLLASSQPLPAAWSLAWPGQLSGFWGR